MSNKRVLLDQFGNTAQYVHTDAMNPDDLIIEDVYDNAPSLEAAKIIADQTPGKEFRHAAVIPEEVMAKAFREGWFHDKSAWKKWANDPANKKFRTWQGRL